MSASRPSSSAPRPSALARLRSDLRRWLSGSDLTVLTLLVVLTLLIEVLMYRYATAVTAASLLVPLMLCDLLLRPRLTPFFVAFLLLVLVVETWIQYGDGIPPRRWVAIGTVITMSGVLLLVGWRRTVLGVGGLTGDALLIDLQNRIRRQGALPRMPEDWHLDAAIRSAGGTSFAGDFLVAHRSPGSTHLSVALVDVSGKGVDAGTRALLLSGAFGALLGAAAPGSFLASANDFLMRQEWVEGFATAVHLHLDLRTGDFELRSAGHPPAIQLQAGTGQWHVHEDLEGPVLGVVPDARFAPATGRIGQGDAMLLYTDGLVERPRRDISLGIDRLIGESERLVRHGLANSARDLVARLGASNDDCALIVLQRS